MRKVWFNGIFIDEVDAKLSIFDSALMFGDTVFTMMRSFNHKHFQIDKHIDRIINGCKILHIPLAMSKDDFIQAIDKLTTKNAYYFPEGTEHRITINVSRGTLGIYKNIVPMGTNIIIADFPLSLTVQGMGKYFDRGIDMVIPSQRSIPAQYLDPKIKNRSRINFVVANIQASQFEGEDNWALLLDDQGYITEGTGDNFFIVKGGCVISPEGRNILRGISRDYIRQLCVHERLSFIEKNIEPYDVYTADEAFISATPFCILPVRSLNKIPISSLCPGKIYSKLLKFWSEYKRVDIKKQIQNWNKEDGEVTGPTPYQFKETK